MHVLIFEGKDRGGDPHGAPCMYLLLHIITPDFKDKIRYAPYVSFRRQDLHIATNKG